MTTFTPVNSLEISLRALLTDKTTLAWSFYTPLAASELWIITQNYPELDGSDEVAPEGQNPGVCLFQGPKETYVGLYTAECRVQEAFEKLNLSRSQMIWRSAPGYQLLQFISNLDASLWINCGLEYCHFHPDPQMIDILLSRPEPTYDYGHPPQKLLQPAGDPAPHLGPLHDFLSRQPNVRAAWIFADQPAPTATADQTEAYVIHLLMADPEDNSLLDQVKLMAKALTPIHMEWQSSVLMADDANLRKLAKHRAPFYEAPDFQNLSH